MKIIRHKDHLRHIVSDGLFLGGSKMKIYRAFDLDMENGQVISIVGGGGKTTTLFGLAEELKSLGKKVMISTTTAIFEPNSDQYDDYFLEDLGDFHPEEGTITIYGEKVKKGKLREAVPEKIESIIERELFDFILIEADGARGLPIKAPADHEPVIVKSTSKTIGVIGLDSLGEKIEDISHRPEILTEITKTRLTDLVDENLIVELVLSDKGLFKTIEEGRVVLLNKADSDLKIASGRKIKEKLLDRGFIGVVVIADIRSRLFY